MSVAILDPLLRGLNDHHWSHIEACATYCTDFLKISPTLHLPDDAFFAPEGLYDVRRTLLRPQYSSYNEFPFEEYLQYLVWFDQSIKPSLRSVLTTLGADVDLVVPNCTLPLLYSILTSLKKIKALRSIRLYMVQVYLPSEPGLGVQLIRTLLERIYAGGRIQKVLVALPHKAHNEIARGAHSAFWGDNCSHLWSYCRPVMFNPLSPEVYRIDNAPKGCFDIVFFGHINPEKNDFSGLSNLLDQGLTLSICVPRNSLTESVAALIDRMRAARPSDVLDVMVYDSLSSSDFIKLASRGRFSYLVSFGDYYSSKGGYSNRVLEALVSANPAIASPDAFQHLPFFDIQVDAILEADSQRLQDPLFCRKLATVVRNDHEAFQRRAVSRQVFWKKTVVEFGFERTFLSDLQDAYSALP
jgi:hypothetical protein